MKIKRIDPKWMCVNCDCETATIEISHNGAFKFFWACSFTDREICLCEKCFNQLKHMINNFEK